MLRSILNILIVALSVLVSSCFKEDKLVTPHVPGNYITDTIALTGSYKYQVYYSLSDSTIQSSGARTLWDLGFENTPGGWRVILNSSCFMKAAFLSDQEFGLPTDTTGARWLFNPSDGSADSLATGQWFTIKNNDTVGTNRVLLIDRGIDEGGNPRGFNQLVIDSLVNGTYYFRLASINGTNPRSYSVSKHGNTNHLLFSITDPSSQVSEPASPAWDLLFTEYTTLLYTDLGQPYPYLLTGVLLNPAYVEVAVDSVVTFESITFDKAQSLTFSKNTDKIGYNWKRYNFSLGTYSVNSDINYIIRDTKGFLYKLRFIGFYKFNKNKLEKGFPSFEYQKL